MKRDCLLFSVNVKMCFEFFVMREKADYLCETVFGRGIGALCRLDVIDANTSTSLLIQPFSRKSFERNSAKNSLTRTSSESFSWLVVNLSGSSRVLVTTQRNE